MKIIFKIARAELRTLFYSPVAWITIVVFFVISGMQFLAPLVDASRIQQLKLDNSPGWGGLGGPLTYNLIAETLVQATYYIYLFVPLLTMGTISREENAGTMNLLSSSPVSIREIVLGKYLGLLLFNFVLMSSVALLLLTGYFSIQFAELSWLGSMLLSLVLYSSCLMAIGLFISCITNYQIVAGITTFLVFSLLGMMGNIFQQYDFFRDLTWFLYLAGRTQTMFSGLITTRDVFYYLLIITLFLGLAMIKLKSRQESKSWRVSFLRNTALITVILMIGYFSSRPGHIGYLDVTRDKINTIDTATQAVLKELDGSSVTVTLYTNLLGAKSQMGFPAARNIYVWQFWDKYVRFYPNIKWKYVYYYDIKKGDSSLYRSFPGKNVHYIAKQMAKLYNLDVKDFLKPGEVDKLVDLSGEDELRLVMQLEYKGKKSFARFPENSRDPWPTQPQMSGSFRRLVRDSTPNILFTTGHYERSPWKQGEREFGAHVTAQLSSAAIVNNGMDADTISLLNHDIPAQTSLLVVADPRSELEVTEQEKILHYLDKGGNAMFYGEPGKQQLLNSILNKLGVNLDKGILVNPGPNGDPHLFMGYLNKTGNFMAREIYMQFYQKTGAGGAGGFFIGNAAISSKDTNGFKVEPILTVKGNANTWIENGVFVADSAAPLYAPAEGDIQKNDYNLGLRLTRKINNKEQRILIMGDADFMTPNRQSGGTIGLGLYSWLVNNEYPVYTEYKLPKDVMVNTGKNTAKLLWYLYVYVLPGCLLLTGTIILIRRKRK